MTIRKSKREYGCYKQAIHPKNRNFALLFVSGLVDGLFAMQIV